jgi:hypothetical protein
MARRQSSRGLPTADLSTALRSGRDDKGEGGYGPAAELSGIANRRSLHCAMLRSR